MARGLSMINRAPGGLKYHTHANIHITISSVLVLIPLSGPLTRQMGVISSAKAPPGQLMRHTGAFLAATLQQSIHLVTSTTRSGER